MNPYKEIIHESDRPALKEAKERWNRLVDYWESHKRGPYDLNFTEWRLSEGLSTRTAREGYWDAGEIRGAIRKVEEKKQRFWECCNSGSHTHSASETEQETEEESFMEHVEKHPKEKPMSKKLQAFVKLQELRNKLKAGPCKDVECPPEEDCENCSGNPENRSEAVE